LSYVPERIPLSRLSNPYACRVLSSICRFLAYYLTDQTDEIVQGVAEALFAAHREKAILDVLEVKDEEVLVSAVECLNSIPLRFLTKETVALLLNLLRRLAYPHIGLNSLVLQTVVLLLTSLASWDSPQAVPVLKSTIENMHALNKACVDFLLAASRVEDVRDIMRLADIIEGWPDLPDAGKDLGLRDFVRLCIAERLSLLLAPLCSRSTTQRHSRQRALKENAEYWAGRLKADIEDAEAEIAKAKEEAAEEADVEELAVLHQPQKRSELVKSITQAKPKSWREKLKNRNKAQQESAPAKKPSSKQSKSPTADLEEDPAYADLYGTESNVPSLWLNFHAAELQPAYIIAATLRLLYAAIAYPVIAVARSDTLRVCRRIIFLRTLTSLVEAVPFAAANVGAKFCRLMQRVLQIEPHQPAESMDLILNYDIVGECTRQMMVPLRHLVRQASTRPLDLKEQILCMELAGLYATLARQIPYIKFSEERDVQDWAVEKTYERLFPVTTIQLFVSMLIMDLAIDAGSSHGTYVSHLMARLGLQRERMRVDCISIISALMQHCPQGLSYDAIEALHYARVFLHYPIRPSVMYELMDLTNIHYFKRTLELLLSSHSRTAERILQLAPVLWWNALEHQDEEPVRQMAVATNCRFYIIERPRGLREPLQPEVEYAYRRGSGIRIIVMREYSRMTRIVKGFPSDEWLAVGWIHKDSDEEVGQELFDCLITEVLHQADDLISCLRACSGQFEDERVDVLRDVVSAECLMQHLKLHVVCNPVLAISRTTSSNSAPVDRLGLYVLTGMYLHEFFIDWKYWFAFDPTSTEEKWGVQLLCLDLEADAMEWQGPRGGLGNFLGWIDPDIQRLESVDAQREREEAIEQVRLGLCGVHREGDGVSVSASVRACVAAEAFSRFFAQGLLSARISIGGPAWLRQIFGTEAGRTQRRLDAAKEHLLTPGIKYKLDGIRQIEFGGGEACWVELTWRIPKASKGEQAPKKSAAPTLKLLLLDDTSRERFRRALAAGLNRTEESMWDTKPEKATPLDRAASSVHIFI
ncbi:uncharacterized protein LOC113147500, partial [Cyclospora cayetanensis]|uniref:Uncharacterized protein LOC113147500 n=1 Tax=Cyclospora cayetanensis TaxID=88456 RepID=A0A6P6S2N3_9EIME